MAVRGRSRHVLASSRSAASSQQPSSAAKLVLVVDDDVPFARDVCEALRSSGYRAVVAGDGHEAMRFLLLGGLRPAAILLDLNMPAVDGFSFLDWFTRQRDLYRIPVIVSSAALRAVPSGITLSVAATLEKPFSVEALLEALDDAAA